MISIDKNIPIPPEGRRGKQERYYPWKDMEIGDSFLSAENDAYIRRSMSYQNKNTEKAFISRNVEGGVRVWRIK